MLVLYSYADACFGLMGVLYLLGRSFERIQHEEAATILSALDKCEGSLASFTVMRPVLGKTPESAPGHCDGVAALPLHGSTPLLPESFIPFTYSRGGRLA